MAKKAAFELLFEWGFSVGLQALCLIVNFKFFTTFCLLNRLGGCFSRFADFNFICYFHLTVYYNFIFRKWYDDFFFNESIFYNGPIVLYNYWEQFLSCVQFMRAFFFMNRGEKIFFIHKRRHKEQSIRFKNFTNEQREYLEKSPYLNAVYANRVSYSDAFIQLYIERVQRKNGLFLSRRPCTDCLLSSNPYIYRLWSINLGLFITCMGYCLIESLN